MKQNSELGEKGVTSQLGGLYTPRGVYKNIPYFVVQTCKSVIF